MADSHYEVNEGLYHARKLMEPVREITSQWYRLIAAFKAMDTMKDGDGSQAAHFAKVTALYGTGSDAMSKAIYDELNSTQGNSAALLQLLARLG